YCCLLFFFLFNDTAPPPTSTLSLHDALPISKLVVGHLLAVEVTREELLVGLDDRLHELLAVLADTILLRVRRGRRFVLRTLEDRAVEEIDRPRDAVLVADRDVERHDADAVRLAELREDT